MRVILGLPSVQGGRSGAPQIVWNQGVMPTIESSPDTDGPGFSVALMSYLTQVWLRTCAPTVADSVFTLAGVLGDGTMNVQTLQDSKRCSAANVQILNLPPDTDEIFGQNPLLYVGMCGFGYTPLNGGAIQVGERSFSLGVTFGETMFGRANFINHANTIWFPEDASLNTFWYQLKPGVLATINLYGQDNGFGVSQGFGTAQPQRYQPLAGGWRPYDAASLNDPQVLFDGGGAPV